MDSSSPILTIAIPTYNRPIKLIRLLEILKRQVEEAQLQDSINIVISDNAENEDSSKVFEGFLKGTLNIQYYHQAVNLGFDGNLLFLFENANTPYVWFISDDDFPLEGGIIKMVNALRLKQPDILLFSFMQPPGSPARQFNFDEPLHTIQNPAQAIATVVSYPKLSVFILRKVIFTEENEKILAAAKGEGWMFLTLSIAVLSQANAPLVAVCSEQLASADEDYNHIWVPTPFLWRHKIAQHPYIKKYLPALESAMKMDGYEACIKFSWALKRGILLLDDMPGLDYFIKKLDWRFSFLIKKPKLFFMLVLLKIKYMPSFLQTRAA